MTEMLFRKDAYARDASAKVTAITDEGEIVLNGSVFYPTSGGQPGDSGRLTWNGGEIEIATAVKGGGDDIVLVPAEPSPLPAVGTRVDMRIAWDRRYAMMRMHTALHLLSVVIPLPVTGGSIGTEKGRLDFDMPDAPDDKDALTETLNKLIACDFAVTEEFITDAALDANPGLVKTMSVQPPRWSGEIRLIRIGEGENTADLQPCGGTHVRQTSEIGRVRIGKVEKKGRQNRRVYLHLEDGLVHRPLFLIVGVFAIALGVLLVVAPSGYLDLYLVQPDGGHIFAAQRLAPAVIGLGAMLVVLRALETGPVLMRISVAGACIWFGVAATGVFHFLTGTASWAILVAATIEVVVGVLFLVVARQTKRP